MGSPLLITDADFVTRGGFLLLSEINRSCCWV